MFSSRSGGSVVPRPMTSFVGRERELAEASRLLAGNRLLALTGPGGSGKTRLAIELTTRVIDDFPDGVYFVPLAAIRDPALVPSSIAQSLGLQDSRERPLVEHLASYLGERRALLVLDNFERVLGAAELVADLLAAGDGLHVLVTSRAPLHLSGEQEFPVPPLAVPDARAATTPASLAAYESVRLFAARAAAEHGTHRQQPARDITEQLVAPGDRVAQGLLPIGQVATPAHEQAEGLVQASQDRLRW